MVYQSERVIDFQAQNINATDNHMLRREGLNYEAAKVECGCSQLAFT